MVFQRVYVFESEGFGLFQYYNPADGTMFSDTVHLELKNPLAMHFSSHTDGNVSDASVSLQLSAQHLDQIASAWIRARNGEIPMSFRSAE